MKQLSQPTIGLAIALFSLAGGLTALVPAPAEAGHREAKGAIDSRSVRDFARRLGRAHPPRVFVRVRGDRRLGEAVRYELREIGGRRDVVFAARPGRADLVLEVAGLVSDPYIVPRGRRLKTVKFPRRYRRAPYGRRYLYARFERVRERVRIDYDLRLTLRGGGRIYDRDRAYGYVSARSTSARNYRVVTPAGFLKLEVFPSRRIEALVRGRERGRRAVIEGLERRLARAVAYEIMEMRFPDRLELRRGAWHGARLKRGLGSNRWRGMEPGR